MRRVMNIMAIVIVIIEITAVAAGTLIEYLANKNTEPDPFYLEDGRYDVVASSYDLMERMVSRAAGIITKEDIKEALDGTIRHAENTAKIHERIIEEAKKDGVIDALKELTGIDITMANDMDSLLDRNR